MVYSATGAEMQKLEWAYDLFAKKSGYFHGVFDDPFMNADGYFEVRCTPDAGSCLYRP